jgi:Immunity protein Imm1
LNEHVRTLHDDPMPIGLYILFDQAWKAVQEFIVTDGKLPTSIEWINNRDLPPNTFPDP